MSSKSESKQRKKNETTRPKVPTQDQASSAHEIEASEALQRAMTPGQQALSPGDVLSLQQTVGNRSVQRVLDKGGFTPPKGVGREGMVPVVAAQPDLQRKVAHTTGKKVDTYLKADKFIKKYVKKKFKGGTKAEGNVHIHTAAKFKEAWKKYAKPKTNPDTGSKFTEAEVTAWEPKVNAFQGSGEIHIHEDRGEAGTAIHESIHLFSSKKFLSKLGFNVNEGSTEFFTRIICKAQSITRGGFYTSQRTSVDKLVAATSKEKLASAFFNGKVNALKKALDGSKSKGTFTKWTKFMKKGKYSDADALL